MHLFKFKLPFIIIFISIISCGREVDSKQLPSTVEEKYYNLNATPHYEEDYQLYGQVITFFTDDNKEAKSYVQVPAEKENRVNSLVIFHDKFGLTDEVKREVDRIFQALDKQMITGAPDFYDGRVPIDLEMANEFSASLDEYREDAILRSFLGGMQLEAAKRGEQPKMVFIGFGEDGAYRALKAAIHAEDKSRGCVLVYDFPKGKEIDLNDYQTKTLVLQDNTPNLPEGLSSNFEIHNFEGESGFASPFNNNFNLKEGNRANRKLLEFVKMSLEK